MAGPLLPFVTSQILAGLRPSAPSGIAQFLPRRGLGEDVVRGIGALVNAIREEPPNYNLPTDYSVGPQGEIFSSTGERMVTGQGVSGFQPENQYGINSFEEPSYAPPIPWNYSLSDAANIPSQIPMGTPAQEFPPQRTYSQDLSMGLPFAMSSVAPPVESVDQELERLAARYAQQAPSAEEEEEETASVWWPQAPQVDPRFLEQQQSQQR